MHFWVALKPLFCLLCVLSNLAYTKYTERKLVEVDIIFYR